MSNFTRIQSLDDPRLAPYRALKDRELARDGGRFIAEGEQVVLRLLRSSYETESVLLARRRVEEIAPIVPATVSVYAVSDELMTQVIGFRFHSGVIACGKRGPRKTIDGVVGHDSRSQTLVICPEIANAENMGAMIRISAAFGARLILGERSCDPFWRQSIRVSMGTIFSLPLVHSDNLLRDLKRLQTEWNFELAATVLDETAELLARAGRSQKLGLLFGNEAQGLDPPIIAACDRRITIPMQLGTDSLNVAVAAGIVLYHFTKEI